MNRRSLQYFKDGMFALAMAFAALAALSILGFMLLAMFRGGGERLTWDFLVKPSIGGDGMGGVLYQIVGTLILLSTAAIIVIPASLAVALFHAVVIRSRRLQTAFESGLHILNATPSILYGILGFIVFIRLLEWDKSWLSGGLILGFMILPSVTLSLVERIKTIPGQYLDTARGLGFDDERLVRAVLLPYSWGGLWTGLVMGLARAAGETAPIMFTAVVFFGASLPSGVIDSPVVALPYHIFNLAQDVFGDGALATAWATAIVLLGAVALVTLAVVPMRIRAHEEAK